MNIVLTILAAIVALLFLLLIVALFVKKEYEVRREIKIQRPLQEVFDYVKYLKNQDHYSKWVMTDPGARKIYKGSDGNVGFIYSWDSENKQVGKGEQEIKAVREGEALETEVRFVKPFENTATTVLSTKALQPNETLVSWGMYGKSKYPLNLMTLMMSGILGKDLETSLQTLKSVLETKKAYASR